MQQKRKRMRGRGKNNWPPTSCLGGDICLLCYNFSKTFSHFFHHSRKLKFGRLLLCPGVRLCEGVLGCSKWADLNPHTPLHHFTHPRRELWSNAGWRSWKTLAWTAALRGNPNLHLSCLDLTSQAAMWSRQAGGVCAGGNLGTQLSECGPRCTQEIPPQDKSTAFCLMLLLFLPLICLLQPEIHLQYSSLFLLQVKTSSLEKSACE